MRRASSVSLRTFVALALGASTLLWGGPSWAQQQTSTDEGAEEAEAADKYAPRPQRPFDRNGFYLGLAAHYSLEMFDEDDAEAATGQKLSPTNAWGVDARVGYRFHPHLAAEVICDYYQEFEFENHQGMDFVRLEGFSVTGNGKVFFLKGRWQPYLVAGAGVIDMSLEGHHAVQVDRDATELVVRGGPGLDVYLWDDIVLSVEGVYVRPFGSLDDYPMFSAVFGAQYRF